MTIKEFIEKEKEKNNLIGYSVELSYYEMKKSNNSLYMADKYKYELYGMFRALYNTDYITKDEYDNLFDDTQNEHYNVIKNILNI